MDGGLAPHPLAVSFEGGFPHPEVPAFSLGMGLLPPHPPLDPPGGMLLPPPHGLFSCPGACPEGLAPHPPEVCACGAPQADVPVNVEGPGGLLLDPHEEPWGVLVLAVDEGGICCCGSCPLLADPPSLLLGVVGFPLPLLGALLLLCDVGTAGLLSVLVGVVAGWGSIPFWLALVSQPELWDVEGLLADEVVGGAEAGLEPPPNGGRAALPPPGCCGVVGVPPQTEEPPLCPLLVGF